MKLFALMASTALLTTACTSGPSLPDPEPIDQGKIEKTKDWDDWGPDENQAKREASLEGTRLTSAQLQSTFGGRVLRGCYPNGEKFAETLGTDGKFFDAMQNNAELGVWGVKDNQLCFRYPERAAQGQPDSCFVVMKVNNTRFDFYTPDLAGKVATTDCQ